MSKPPAIQHIFHPTDLSAGGEAAFLHALRLAVDLRASLTVMHVAADKGTSLEDLPTVRATLTRWGLLHGVEDTEGLKKLGVGVRKVISSSGDPVGSCSRYMAEHAVDLIVLGTHQEGGRMAWLRERVAEPMAREAKRPALLVPHGNPGFLDPATGQVRLRHILVPVVADPSPVNALAWVHRSAEALGVAPVGITLLHIGEAKDAHGLRKMVKDTDTARLEVRQGPVVETILEEAVRTKASLVVMPTKGHDGFLDALRGSTTERVLRAVPCPLLAIPA